MKKLFSSLIIVMMIALACVAVASAAEVYTPDTDGLYTIDYAIEAEDGTQFGMVVIEAADGDAFALDEATIRYIDQVGAADGKLSQMYKIVSTILGKNLSSADIEVLYSMHDYYRLPPEVIVVMTEYFSGRGITTMRKLEKEAQKWSEAGVDTVAKAKRHIKKREEFLSYAGTVKRIVGAIERKLTTKELEFIGRWQQELKATPEAVKEAYEITINNTGKLSFNYMNKVIEARINEKSKPAPVKKETAKKSRYDFSQLEKKAFMKVTGEGGVKNGV